MARKKTIDELRIEREKAEQDLKLRQENLKKLKAINFNIVSMGSINGSVAAIPNILKSGILSNAAGFLLLHNHPSGDVTPSKEDITATRRCVAAGKLMDIPCLDHVIVGGSNRDMFSFRESGMVDFTSDKISMTAEEILRVNESNSSYKGGTETMPENGRKEDLFVPDFVKEAEEQIAKGVKLPTQRSNDQVWKRPRRAFPVEGRQGVYEDPTRIRRTRHPGQALCSPQRPCMKTSMAKVYGRRSRLMERP